MSDEINDNRNISPESEGSDDNESNGCGHEEDTDAAASAAASAVAVADRNGRNAGDRKQTQGVRKQKVRTLQLKKEKTLPKTPLVILRAILLMTPPNLIQMILLAKAQK